jgi:Flp pilus assembly protein TadB
MIKSPSTTQTRNAGFRAMLCLGMLFVWMMLVFLGMVLVMLLHLVLGKTLLVLLMVMLFLWLMHSQYKQHRLSIDRINKAQEETK